MMRFLSWLLLLLSLAEAGLGQPVLPIRPGFSKSYLSGYLSRFDTAGVVSAPNLPRRFGQFRPATDSVVNYRSDSRHHYLRFRLVNAEARPRHLILNLQQLFFDQADLFLYTRSAVGTDSLISRQLSGWRVPVAQRPLPYRLHNFRLVLAPGQTLTAVLHTHVSPRQRTSRALLALYDEQAFRRYDAGELLLQGVLYGAILLVFSFGLTFLLLTRQVIYAFYCVYTGSQLAYVLNINGVFGQLFDQANWLTNPTFGLVMVSLSTIFHGGFYLRFIDLKQYAPTWLWYLMNGLIGSMLLVTGWIVAQPEAYIPYQLASYGNYFYVIGLLGCLGLGAWHRRRAVRIVGLALLPMALLWIYYLLAGRWLPTYRFLYVSAFYPVLLFEMITLGVGLVYRFNAARRQAVLKLNEATRTSARQVMLAQEQERQQIAANLHDDLGGTLATLHGELSRQNEQHLHQHQPHLQTALDLIQRATHDLRLIAHHLMPATFAQIGLSQAIQQAVDLADQQTDTRVLLVSPGPERRLSPELEINAYRILRELLTNALRHAQATRIVVQLIFYPHFLYISVEDNGRGMTTGFDPAETASRPGMGLKNIQSRVTFLRANLITETSPAGTLIAIEIPYDSPDSTQNSPTVSDGRAI